MPNITMKEIQKYIQNIRRLMPIYSKAEKQYLSFLQERIFDYINENPFCTIDNIYMQFGEPKVVMEHYLQSLEHEYIREKLQVKHRIQLFAAICVIIAGQVLKVV